MIRKVILFLLGIGLMAGAFYIANNFIENRQRPSPRENKVITSVFTQRVHNGDVPITITTNGTLTAKYRMELYSEVQGVFENSAREFKAGMHYKKGEILLNLNADEHMANLRSQKSNLFNQIVLLLPDLRLDFEESFPA